MRRVGPTGRLGIGLVAVAAAAGAVLAVRAARADDALGYEVLGPGVVSVELRMHHSRFIPDTIHVRPGTTVQFTVANDDPIDHEFIVGPQEVHDRHEGGRERAHPPVPGEVSVPPGTAAATFYAFEDGAPVVFACHLPGHYAYGMRGTIEVEDTG